MKIEIDRSLNGDGEIVRGAIHERAHLVEIVLTDGTALRLQERTPGELQINCANGRLEILPEVSNSIGIRRLDGYTKRSAR